jgi:hypothetical protein
MQRVQPDHVGALPGHAVDQRVQVREIADAPVARRAQRIQLHRRPPHAAAVAHRRRPVATPGRCDDHGLAVEPVDPQPVVAGRERFRQVQDAAAVVQRVRIGLAIAKAAFFIAQVPAKLAG